MKRAHFFTLCLLLFYLGIVNVSALGIMPSRIPLDFAPNFIDTYTVHVTNNRREAVFISPIVRGDLEKYIRLHTTKAKRAEIGETVNFTFTLSLPSAFNTPGMHYGYVGAHEEPVNPPKGVFLATTTVETLIKLKVPFPGKYAKVDLIVPNVDVGEKANFKMRIENLGKEDIVAASGTLTIVEGNENIKEKSTKQISILSKKYETIPISLDTNDMRGGDYKAIAIVDYDGLKTSDEKGFKLGSFFVNLTNYTREFRADKINRWDFWFESRWNQPAEVLYAEAKIIRNGQEVDIGAKTPTVNLGPWQTTRLVAYWDTSEFATGNYDAKIRYYYHGKTEEKLVKIKILKAKSKATIQIPYAGEISLTIFFVTIIIAVVLLDIFWLILIKRKKDKKNEKQK